MTPGQAISEFKRSCQEYYICYSVAAIGLEQAANRIAALSPDRTKTFHIGTGPPEVGDWQASISMGKYLDSSVRGGAFSDQLAKAFVTAIFSSWDELYRPRIAEEAKVATKKVRSDLMGDLRHIRHCIVHKNSVVTSEHRKLKELNWPMLPGALRITPEMFKGLIDQINTMRVVIEPS